MNVQPCDLVAALRYVAERPGVSIVQFVKDHAPLGNTLWAGLFYADHVALNQAGTLHITTEGRGYLAAVADATTSH